MAVSMKKPGLKDDAALFAAHDELVAAREKQTQRILEMRQEIAAAACPYKVGQTITTNTGLGKQGLKVDAIGPTPEGNFSQSNRWSLTCYALQKDGQVSRRVVGVAEYEAPDLEIKVKS